jgi:hypothetical protein
MAKQPMPPSAMLGKPSRKSKYSKADEAEMEDEDEDEEEGCGCGHGDDEGVVIKISLLLPDMLQPKSR